MDRPLVSSAIPFVDAPPPPDAAPDLRVLAQVLVRRRWYVVAAVLASLGFAALATIRTPRVYRATAVVMIERETPQVLGKVREVYNLGTGTYWNTQEYYQTQYRVIRSRAVAEKVAATLGINGASLRINLEAAGQESTEALAANDPLHGLQEDLKNRLRLAGVDRLRSRAEMIESLEHFDAPGFIAARVKVSPVKDSRLVEVSIEDTDPKRAALIANAVASAYLEVNIDQKVDFTRSAVDWLSDQMLDLKDKLQKSELALFEFKKANNIVSVSMEDRQTIISQTLAQLNQSLSEVKADRFGKESRRKRIREARSQGSNATVEDVINNDLVQRLKANEVELKQKEAEASLRYTEDHPALIAVRKKLQLVRNDLKDEVGKIVATLDAQYTEALDTERRLRGAIGEVKAEALEINKKEIEYSRLSRERDNNQALHDMVLKRRKEAELTQMLKVNNVRIHEMARAPSVPIRPRVQLNMMIALVLGLFGGIGLAFLIDYLDNTVKSQEQVEQLLDLPFLGIIPAIKADKGVALVDAPDRDHYIVAHPRSSVAECCRTVRTNLLFMSPDRPARQLLVTSSGPREGKSTTAVNLAVTMAQSGARTVVVDTDMRRPRLHKSFGVENERGVSNVILGDTSVSDVLLPGGMENLSVIPCGPIPPNPAELLHTESFKQFVHDLSKQFDRVLFDSPPVAAVTDALVLASMMDGVILVVQSGKTSWQAARQASRRLEDVGAKIFGVVLNNVDLDDKHSGTYYQYYYYRSGYSDEQKKKAV